MLIGDIKEAVRQHRRLAGLSQEELAQLAGVGKTVIFDIEHGKKSVRFNTLLKVLTSLNISLEIKTPVKLEALVQSNKRKTR